MVAPLELPEDCKASVFLAEHSRAKGDERVLDKADQAKTGWCTGTITRLKKQAPKASNNFVSSVKLMLDIEGDSERWVDLSTTPFFLHASTSKDWTVSRSIRKLHLLAAGGQDSTTAEEPPTKKRKTGTKGSLGTLDQQRLWMANMKNNTLPSAAEIMAESGSKFDFMNLAGALSRLARSVPFPADARPKAHEALEIFIDRIVADAFDGYSARSVANIGWALGKMSEAKAIPMALRGKVSQVGQNALARLFQDIATATEDDSATSVWQSWAHQEVANVCWGAVRCVTAVDVGSKAQKSLSLVAQCAALTRWSGFKPQELSNIVSALTPLSLAPPALVEICLQKLEKNRSLFEPQHICGLLVAASKSGVPRATVRKSLVSILKEVGAADLYGYTMADFNNLMWVLASLEERDEEWGSQHEAILEGASFIQKLCIHMTNIVYQTQPPELAGILFSLSKLLIRDDDLCRAVALRWKSDFLSPEESGPRSARSPQTLCNVILAMARLAVVDLELTKLICERLSNSIQKDPKEWDSQSTCCILYASASILALGIEDGEDAQEAAASVSAAFHVTQKLILQGGLKLLPRHKSMLHRVGSVLSTIHSQGLAEVKWKPNKEFMDDCEKAATRYGAGKSKSETLEERSTFHKKISDVLGEVLPTLFPSGCKKKNEVNLDGFIVDLYIRPTKGDPFAVEVDGRTHFTTTASALTEPLTEANQRMEGASRVKRWLLLQLQGVQTLSVAKHHVNLYDEEQMKKYLKKLIKHAGLKEQQE